MADEPETQTPAEPPETQAEPEPDLEPVAPPRQARRTRKPPEAKSPFSDDDIKRLAGVLRDDLIEGLRDAGAFDAPVEAVAAPQQPTVPPAPTDVAPSDGPPPAPAAPVRHSIAQKLLGNV